jgi:hypothetical protein
MKADFSRDSFDPGISRACCCSRGGRADRCELQRAGGDPAARPARVHRRSRGAALAVGEGFAIDAATVAYFTIGAGRFYLCGMACESADTCHAARQRARPALGL